MRLKSKRMKRGTHKLDTIITIMMWVVPILIVAWLLWAQNNLLITKNFIYGDTNLPKSFVGYKIVHIADICNSSIDIASQVKKADPDIIVLSGGYQDKNGGTSNTISTVNKLTQIAPVYYIYSTNDTTQCLSNTAATNITNIEIKLNAPSNSVQTFIENAYGKDIIKKANKGDEESLQYMEYVAEMLNETAGAQIAIMGLDTYVYENGSVSAVNKLYELESETEGLRRFLLLGNFNYLETLSNTNVNTIFFGGTYGTNNISDKYSKGTYGLNGAQLFVSGGVGTNGTIKRIFNFPEIQCITLSDGTITENNPLENFIALFYNDVGTIFDNDGGFKNYTYSY
jgi:predicted MPP superfamily phosphohydrolase